MTKVKSRFAPSPTGRLHIGNIRAAIITWLFVRSQGGEFMLRIDDTDAERSKDEYTQTIKEDLTWLGLNWDSYAHQRDRFDRYNEVIQKLKDDGRLYPCYETAEELDLKRNLLLKRGKPPLYDRGALNLTDAQKAAYEAEGRRPHWRFKMNDAPIEWDDIIRGKVSFHGKDMSDPVLIREDGSPLYHICSVIDDIDFEITHVVRGEDHVSNTASHIQMMEAIGGKVPTYAHTSLISDAQGGKLSKRIGSLGISQLRDDEGLEPMAIISLISRLGTSDPIDAVKSLDEAVANFDFSKFSRGTPKFDPNDLDRLNAKLLHEMSYEEAKSRLPEGADKTFWETVKPNLEKMRDINELYRIIYGPVEPVIDDQDYAVAAAETLPDAPWDNTTWSTWVGAIKDKTGRKGKELFMPLRLALTGMEHGPELANMLPLIGREKTLKRLKKAA
ncbi:MAG: glutamate--tRNA ligase [Micavibrio sp.]|nr:glutamate--tRNA ligase [Micavibrio sp.]